MSLILPKNKKWQQINGQIKIEIENSIFTDCLESTWLKLKELNPCRLVLRLFSFHNLSIINFWFRNLININNRTTNPPPPPHKDFYRIS